MAWLSVILFTIILIFLFMAAHGCSFWVAVLSLVVMIVLYAFFSNIGDIYRFVRDKIRDYRNKRKERKQEEEHLKQQQEVKEQRENQQQELKIAKAPQKHFFVCHLAGRSYHDADMVKDLLQVGTPLLLMREADNLYDKNAVAVVFHNDANGKDYCLGYIPRADNEHLAQILDAGHTDLFKCCILEIAPDAHPERQIRLAIDIIPAPKN